MGFSETFGPELATLMLLAALGLDLAVGDPPNLLHPTAWLGAFAERLKSALTRRRGHVSLRREKAWGVALALATLAVAVSLAGVTLYAAWALLGYVGYAVLGAVTLKLTFAVKGLEGHAKPVAEALLRGDLAEARRRVALIVRRETAGLDEQRVVSAAVESVAESTVDGVTSPLLAFGLFGVPGAVAYRAINTLDSAVGYRTPEFLGLGWFSARLDTVVNYPAARLTGLLMVAAAWLVGESPRGALRTLLRDHAKPLSLNAGWPMAAMSGALGVRLEKPAHYALGDDLRPPRPADVLRALRIMKVTVLLFVVLVVLPCLYGVAALWHLAAGLTPW